MNSLERISFPAPEKSQVWIDFDGTISKKDTLDELITRFSINDSWHELERLWRENLIGSRECLEGEFALLRITKEELNEVLGSMQIDAGLLDILELCEQRSIPVAVVSDGIDFFIKKILSSNGVFSLVVRSNTAKFVEGRFTLECPHNDPKCDVKAAHCKCASMKALGQPGRRNIYIGDGRSDLCPARKADIVFAKNVLAACLKAENIGHIEYTNLGQVASVLSSAWMPAEERDDLCVTGTSAELVSETV